MKQKATNEMKKQYDQSPAAGLQRYWIGFKSWCENYPDETFPYWDTGSSIGLKLRPSLAVQASKLGLPTTCSFLDNIPDEVVDQYYYSEGTFTALIDAVDENAAWQMVIRSFPDATIRWEPELYNEATLTTLAVGGRFT